MRGQDFNPTDGLAARQWSPTFPETRAERGESRPLSPDLAPDVEIIGHIQLLREELAEVTEACAAASAQGEPGRLFFLLRKKWQLMQQLFETENQLRLLR